MPTPSNPVKSMPGVETQREQTRTAIAFIALCTYLGLLVLIVIVGWIMRNDTDDVIKLLTAVAGILSGIVGAIIGFYFRDKEETQ